ncbi:MAG: L-threonylcarbamoyladenylate synthase [Clostridia bacterium]
MKTQMLKINAESLLLASKLINNGEIVAFPTETVYGLGANVFCEDAIAKIYVAKGRPNDNPLIVHISDKSMLRLVARDISQLAQKIFDNFMPSSLTVVLNKLPTVPDSVTANLPTVAVRLPRSQEARQFISACNVPICAPSANTSTRPSPTSAQTVYDDMQGKIPLILWGEDCQVGIESTVLSLVDQPTILRPGIVTRSEIERLLGVPVAVSTLATGAVHSPGVKYLHYAPLCPTIMFETTSTEIVKIHYQQHLKDNPVILCARQYLQDFLGFNCLDLGGSEEEIAHNYFSSVRLAEKDYGYIIQMFCGDSELAYSIKNRMTKSVNGNIITK